MTIEPYRVLCIAGGGMRGIYAAAYLDNLSELFEKRYAQIGLQEIQLGGAFDMFVGTSTGAILACALALKKAPKEIVDLYFKGGKSIFPRRLPKSFLKYLWYAPWNRHYLENGARALECALEDAFSNITLRQIRDEHRKSLAVAALEMQSHTPRVFKSWSERDLDHTLVDICLASTAAPLFRSLARIPRGVSDAETEVFADGGLFANNPSMIAVINSLRMVDDFKRPIQIFALGTYSLTKGETVLRGKEHRTILGWKFGGKAAELSIDAQDRHFYFMPEQLLRGLRYRFKNLQPEELRQKVSTPYAYIVFPSKASIPQGNELELDNTDSSALAWLIRQARSDASSTYTQCIMGEEHVEQDNPDRQMIRGLFKAALVEANSEAVSA